MNAMNGESTPTVAVSSVSKTFPGQVALDRVSMSVRPGTVHALVGQNGSGKSTLIKVLDGYHEPDPGGTVSINGTLIERDRAATAHRLGLRCVHQDLGLIDEFNAVENFGLTDGYPQKMGRIDWRTAEERVSSLLNRIGVDLDLKKPLGRSAAVERTAVAVIRAVADLDLADGQGGCLLLDEPTAALDSTEVDRLFEIIAQLTSQGVAVIYVSHRLDEIYAVANEVTILRGGRVVRSSDIESLSRRQLIHDITGSSRAIGVAPPTRATTAKEPVLEVRDLVGVEIRDVSFDVSRGEIVGVAGLLGSGRGELPYLLSGHNKPLAGMVEIANSDAPGKSVKSRAAPIALVPSERLAKAAVAEFSTRENMTLGDLGAFRKLWLRRRLETDFVHQWDERFDIRPADPERKFDTLSGGNQQKVVLAKWIGIDPQVLVIDEPTAGVDVGARDKIYGLLREQVDEGLAIVALSSDLDELVQISDRVLVLRDGRIVAELVAEEINPAGIMHAMTEGDWTTHG